MKPRILIVNDDREVTQQLFWSLSTDYEVLMANDLPTAFRRATIYEPDVSILNLTPTSQTNAEDPGLRLLKFIKAHFPQSKILVLDSVDVQKLGQRYQAYEYLNQPIDLEQLQMVIRRLAPPQLEVI